jgi:hypothetical protein
MISSAPWTILECLILKGSNMQIYKIEAEMEKIFAAYDDVEPEDMPADVCRQLDAMQLELDRKYAGIWALIKNLEAEGAAYAEEAKRLYEIKRSREKRVESLKSYICYCLGEGMKWKSPDGLRQFGWRKSEAVEVTDPDAVPDCYCAFERKPILSEIKKDRDPLIAGEIPGVRLVQRLNLQVK